MMVELYGCLRELLTTLPIAVTNTGTYQVPDLLLCSCEQYVLPLRVDTK